MNEYCVGSLSQICPWLKIDSEFYWFERTRDQIKERCVGVAPQSAVYVTEPKMKILSEFVIKQIVGAWKFGLNGNNGIDFGYEGPAWRFQALVRGDKKFSAVAMGYAWVDIVEKDVFTPTIDMSMEMPQATFRISGLHILNFFVSHNKFVWIEPQTGEIIDKLTKYVPKLMIV